MIRSAIFILTLFSLLTGSCSGRKHKLDRKNLIPEKEMVSIITEMYITDGLLTIPQIRSWASALDSLACYKQIIEQHGYTKETMDKTIQYYFIKNPKQLIKIYDQVLGKLSEMESIVDKASLVEQGHANNFWTGEVSYYFPDRAGNDSTEFSLNLMTAGVYTLTFTSIFYPDDQSVNPRLMAYTCNPDSLETGKRNYTETINYFKDGQPHTYKLSVTVPTNKILHLQGRLYDFDNISDNWEKHVIIENISITFSLAGI